MHCFSSWPAALWVRACFCGALAQRAGFVLAMFVAGMLFTLLHLPPLCARLACVCGVCLLLCACSAQQSRSLPVGSLGATVIHVACSERACRHVLGQGRIT